MAWTNIPDTDVDVDSPLDEDLMGALQGNDRETRVTIVSTYLAETSFTNTSYGAALASFNLYLPDLADYTGLQRRLVFEFEGRVTATNTATYKITDSGAAVDSTEDTETATAYTSNEVTLNFATGLKGTSRTIEIHAKVDAGTGWIRVDGRITGRLYY